MISTFTSTPIPTNVTSSAKVCEKACEKAKDNTDLEAYLTPVDGTASASVAPARPGSSVVEQWTHNPSRPGSNPGRAMAGAACHYVETSAGAGTEPCPGMGRTKAE